MGGASLPCLGHGCLLRVLCRHLDQYQRERHARDDAYANDALTLASFAWNTRLVPADQVPRNREDLLDPRWEGKMAIQDPLQADGAGIRFVTM